MAIADGDANANPVIVARLHNGGGCEPPSEVNENAIDQAFAESNHITVTPHGKQAQYEGAIDERTAAAANYQADLEIVVQATVAATLRAIAGAARVEGVGVVLASSGSLAMVTVPPPGGGPAGGINLGGTEAVPPTNPGVLGTQLQAATTTLNAGLNAYAAALAVGVPASPVLIGTAQAAATVLVTALAAYSTAVTASLSARVKIE